MNISIPKRFLVAVAIMVYTFIAALFGVNLEGVIAIVCPLAYLTYMHVDKYEEIDITDLIDGLARKLIHYFSTTRQ